jgi:transcriptional regulator with XRE-family HTH domain
MSEMRIEAPIPEWDLADRMRKALQVSGIGVQEIADYLGVARNTVSTWINGRNRPSPAVVRLWAMRTGVPLEWLAGGGIMFDKTSPAADLGQRAWSVLPGLYKCPVCDRWYCQCPERSDLGLAA